MLLVIRLLREKSAFSGGVDPRSSDILYDAS
jgi:hypothetical protein